MFSAISRFGLDQAKLRIHLEADDRPAAPCRCSVVLESASGGRIRVRTAADRLYRAVDAAAERLTDRLQRRLGHKNMVGGEGTGPAQPRTRGLGDR
jgi:hypothetical protein